MARNNSSTFETYPFTSARKELRSSRSRKHKRTQEEGDIATVDSETNFDTSKQPADILHIDDSDCSTTEGVLIRVPEDKQHNLVDMGLEGSSVPIEENSKVKENDTEAISTLNPDQSEFDFAETSNQPFSITNASLFGSISVNTINDFAKPQESCDPARLEIFRGVFQCIIEKFKTYGPLLARIKGEYELFAKKCEQDQKLVAGNSLNDILALAY